MDNKKCKHKPKIRLRDLFGFEYSNKVYICKHCNKSIQLEAKNLAFYQVGYYVQIFLYLCILFVLPHLFGLEDVIPIPIQSDNLKTVWGLLEAIILNFIAGLFIFSIFPNLVMLLFFSFEVSSEK